MSRIKHGTSKLVSLVQRNQKFVKAAEKLLELNYAIRNGGVVSRLLAATVVTGELVNIFNPPDLPRDFFLSKNYISIDTPIDGLICELLIKSRLERQMISRTLTEEAYVFYHNDIMIGGIFSNDKYSAGPFVLNGSYEDIIDVMQTIMWADNSDLVLSAKNGGDYSWKGEGKYLIGILPKPGPYLAGLASKHCPKRFSKRLERYGSNPRSVLLRGPTGVGKSVFARHVAINSALDNSRTLKIASSVLKNCNFEELTAMAKLLKPKVLLLDDLSLDDESKTEGFLSLMEILRDPECLVIATVMTSEADDPEKKPEMGDWYFPGMRPGRIDEVKTFFLPTKPERDLILRYYLDVTEDATLEYWDEILELTEGLSGAYLSEVARRLSIHGFENWKEEVTSLIRASPSPQGALDDIFDAPMPSTTIDQSDQDVVRQRTA